MTKKKILITRPLKENQRLFSSLTTLGLNPISIPLIEFELIKKQVIKKKHTGLFFSSLSGLTLFLNNIDNFLTSPDTPPIYTLSEKVRQYLEKKNHSCLFVSKKHSLSDFVSEVKKQEIPQRWLHPCSEKSQALNQILLDSFLSKNIILNNFPFYKSIIPSNAKQQLKQELDNLSSVIFFSGSATQNYLSLLDNLTEDERKKAKILNYYCLGKTSAYLLKEHSFSSIIMGGNGDLPSLQQIIIQREKV